MSEPSRLRRFFSAIWNGITRVRLALSNILFLLFIALIYFVYMGGGAEPPPERAALLLNLAGTKIVNSIGISILIEIIEKMIEIDGKLAFCKLTPTIEKTFHIMGLAQYAGIYPDEESAFADLTR